MYADFGDRLDVCASFSKGVVTPIWFLWRGRRYEVEKVTFRWEERRGRALIKHFSVTDGASIFEIGYDSEKLDWKLIRLYTD
jgi:hypothetical protein